LVLLAGLGRLNADVNNCKTVGLLLVDDDEDVDELVSVGVGVGLCIFNCGCEATGGWNEADKLLKGFFMRRLARKADARLLLIGVNWTAMVGGGAGLAMRGDGGGDVGVRRNDRRSFACRMNALPDVLPKVLAIRLPPPKPPM
jgi:hypothetical protein